MTWTEGIFGVVLLIVGLAAELGIDVIRDRMGKRKQRRSH